MNVSTRTIRRDLQALQEAGFAVYDEGEENETKRWKLDAQPFKNVQEGLSVGDVAALYLSRAVVEGVSGWPLADELRAAFQKIERGLNPRMREFLSTLPQVVTAKAGPRAQQASGKLVDVTRRLRDAVRDRRAVDMRYFSASSNRAKSYAVHPYRLALAQGGVYLVAWVPHYDEFRTFALERIERLTVGEETFRKTRELPSDLFGGSMGAFWAEPERVELEFEARVAPYVRGRTWHDSQQLGRAARRPGQDDPGRFQRLGAPQLGARVWRERPCRETRRRSPMPCSTSSNARATSTSRSWTCSDARPPVDARRHCRFESGSSPTGGNGQWDSPSESRISVDRSSPDL